MIIAGLKLTLLGMGVVTCFLLLLILAVHLSFKVLAAQSAGELAELEAREYARRKKAALAEGDPLLIAIISAAVAIHRART